MKTSLIALALLFTASAGTGMCGMDFDRSHTVGVPRTYCWARQDAGHQTFNGFLNLPCSGSACPGANHIK